MSMIGQVHQIFDDIKHNSKHFTYVNTINPLHNSTIIILTLQIGMTL